MTIFERLSIVFLFLMGMIVYAHAAKSGEIETFRETRSFSSFEACIQMAHTPGHLEYFVRNNEKYHITWYGSSTTMGSDMDFRIWICSRETNQGEMRLISYYLPQPKGLNNV